MKIGDLVTFKSLNVDWVAIVRRIQHDSRITAGHLEVYWVVGSLAGQIKCYHPNQLTKLKRTDFVLDNIEE